MQSRVALRLLSRRPRHREGFKSRARRVSETSFGIPHLSAFASRPQLMRFGMKHSRKVVIRSRESNDSVVNQDLVVPPDEDAVL
jgi:hypothetical protein